MARLTPLSIMPDSYGRADPKSIELVAGRRMLASYATHAEHAAGRVLPEAPSALRSPFQRDRDRIVHSTAFRRLMHKTQVFILADGDHTRTRLTHTLEVAQIARTIARALAIDEDLTEAIALAHDLGHPPFGHAGEEALNRLLVSDGGFDHNAHSLVIVTRLEERYPDFDGLNLTIETLNGMARHNGPVRARAVAGVLEDAGVLARPDVQACLEAQVAALADDIAYNGHDLDDGLRAELLSLERIREVPLAAGILDGIERDHPGLPRRRATAELHRRLVGGLVEDAVAATRRSLRTGGVESSHDVVQRDVATAVLSDRMAGELAQLQAFLMAELYRHPEVQVETARAEAITEQLFQALVDAPVDAPEALPERWRMRGRSLEQAAGLYIAGMTDHYALRMLQELRQGRLTRSA